MSKAYKQEWEARTEDLEQYRDGRQTVGNWELEQETIEYEHPLTGEMVEKESDASSWRLRWEHTETDTYMTVSEKSQYTEPFVWYHARVTINGTTITVGEFTHETDVTDALDWATDWMENHDSVGELYD